MVYSVSSVAASRGEYGLRITLLLLQSFLWPCMIVVTIGAWCFVWGEAGLRYISLFFLSLGVFWEALFVFLDALRLLARRP